jgi:hypothetical protein
MYVAKAYIAYFPLHNTYTEIIFGSRRIDYDRELQRQWCKNLQRNK